jgi:threonine/homoserine/homoserine lactone efflux protein
MAQQNWQDVATDSEPKPVKDVAPTLFSACIPVILGVAATVTLVSIFCPTIRPQSLSWVSLVLVTAFLLLVAGFISGIVAQLICGVNRGYQPNVSASVVLAACLGGLWVPAWVLCLREPSILTVLAGCFCVVSVVRSLKKYDREAAARSASKKLFIAPFYIDDSKALIRVILPSLVVAVMAEAATVAMLLKRYQLASVLVGSCAALLVWYGSKALLNGEEQDQVPSSRARLSVMMAFVFTAVVLMPYLRSFKWAGIGDSIFGRTMTMGRLAQPSVEQPTASNDGYSGIILLPMTDPRKKIIAPRSRDASNAGFRRREPMVIPFDGAYWYFKAPDKRPRPTARVVRGSSTKATIRSSDRYPLLMEAHQRLGTRVDLNCCSSVEIALQNADRHPGPIALELWLVDSALPRVMGRYVGTVTIPSSEGEGVSSERPVEEKLEFPIAVGGKGGEFDEITVVVRLAAVRARAGAQIAIRQFVLQP